MSEDEQRAETVVREAQAVAWHLSLSDADAGAWDDFTTWLEADARHAAAYDRVLAAESDIDDVLPTLLIAANENEDAITRGRWHWLSAGAGAGVAAAAAVAIFYTGFGGSSPEPFDIMTGPGQQRAVTLHDGTQIALNGSTTIMLDRHNSRLAVLKSGEATFTVTHDDKAPFKVSVGDRRIEDVGTIFNVVAVGQSVTVAVKEGRVRYTSGANEVPLHHGQSLTDTGGSGPIVLGRTPVTAIATWRTGRLDYDMQPLGLVTQDLARYLGVPIAVDSSLAKRQFSGTIQIDRNRPRFFARLGKLLGVKAIPDGNGWRITAR